MKTILIIENEIIELENLVGIFKEWQKEINILTAREEQAAKKIIPKQQVDLILYDLSLPEQKELNTLSRLTQTYPYVPTIAIIEKESDLAAKTKELGASHTLERPFATEQLIQHASELLEISSLGTVKGIPIHSLLQMLEGEEKTCTLQVSAKQGVGMIYIHKGAVISAETGEQQDEDAVYTLLTWEDATIEIKHFNLQRQRKINKPLISLIIEAFRLKDERDSLEQRQETNRKPRLRLKHVSTIGHRLTLDIGAQIKIEFNELEEPIMSMMVGMLPDKYLIVTTPTPFTLIKDALESKSRITVKYIYMGRLCMFKTTLLKTIADPHPLLFLDYPPVIHYHELRREKRTAIFIPCTFHLAQHPELYGILVDMSTSGGLCQLKAKGNQPLPDLRLNASVQLHCLLPGLKEEQTINGTIRNIKTNNTESRIGIEFIDIQEYLKEAIESYLYSIEKIVK